MNRDMLSRRLARRGFEVVFAVNGKDGVDLAKSEKPDIILMDMSLPVLDGWQATRELKANPATKHIPVLALTAHAFDDARQKAQSSGCDGFVIKPCLPDDLVTKTVSAVIARAPSGDPARVRAVLADLLAFADRKYGDGHTITCDALAAVAHHEARQGDRADTTVRRTAVRRSVWSYAVRRMPGGLLANLEIGFEADGTIHLVPHLSREPKAGEAAQLETILTQAVDDLYSRFA